MEKSEGEHQPEFELPKMPPGLDPNLVQTILLIAAVNEAGGKIVNAIEALTLVIRNKGLDS